MAFPGVRLATPPPPETVADLPEGDTLAYQVTVRGGPSVSFMGASDFVERNLAGLAPDVAMIAVPATDVTHADVPRGLGGAGLAGHGGSGALGPLRGPVRNPPTHIPRTGNGSTSSSPRWEGPAPRVVRGVIRSTSVDTNTRMPEYLTPYAFA
jgi:hypothetical protein